MPPWASGAEPEVPVPEELPPSARALFDAVTAIGSDLEMHNVLARIAQAASRLTGARYAALGVLGTDGRLADFITHGIDPAAHTAIGDLPRGRGILGLLIDQPEPLRLTCLQDHPASFGFPPHHPPMTTFLGVPVRIRGTVFGNLYLTEKAGGADFTTQDEALTQALATAAGYVIENARAYALSELQRVWLEATTRLGEVLVPPLEMADALQRVAVEARVVSRARAVGVFVPSAEGPRLVARDGREAAVLEQLGAQLPIDPAATSGSMSWSATTEHGIRTALVVPLQTRLMDAATLVLLVEPSSSGVDLANEQRDLLSSFADQSALALDRIQALDDQEAIALLSERDRIARDLHDVVIQRLFATGLSLQGVAAFHPRPEIRERIDRAVTDLDATIRDIRTSIFELHQEAPAGLRAAVTRLVGEYVGVLGHRPRLRFLGPVDTVVGQPLAEQTVAVLREALSNVARHARASSVDVDVEATDDRLVVRVRDDGIGLPTERRESGLRNLRERASDHGGALHLSPTPPHGTDLAWTVPLPR